MRSLLVMFMFLVGCATTGTTPNSGMKFNVGDCLKFNAAKIAEAPPQAREMAASIRITVLHAVAGEYVVLLQLGERKMSEVVPAVEVESSSVKVACTPDDTKE